MLALLSALGVVIPLVATSPQVHAVTTANNEFAIDLYHQMSTAGGNVFFSPYSINKTLAMVQAGAANDTAEEMANVLHFTLGQRQHRAFLETRRYLNSTRSPREVQLLLSANLWGQQGYGFRKEYLGLLEECYGAGLKETDFGEPERARNAINNWADQQTNHRIQGLFAPGTITRDIRLVLASAIYFKGNWAQQFEKGSTVNQRFWTDARQSVSVPMMNQTEKFGYFENGQVQCLRMSYQGNGQAMFVMLPRKRDGLADLEKHLTAELLAKWMGQAREQKVEVTLPKMKLTGEYSLNNILTILGMKTAFVSGLADFSRMDGGRVGCLSAR